MTAAKKNRRNAIDIALAAAAKLPKGPKVRIGKHIKGGDLTMRLLMPVNGQQELALAEMLQRHTKEILDEAGKILGKEVRKL
jgi:hypothetical protein